MKKGLLAGVIFVCCFFCLNVKAAEVDRFETFSEAAQNIYAWVGFIHPNGSFFNEENIINPTIVWEYMAYDNDDYFEDYVDYDMYTDPETGVSFPSGATFSVPADVFENVLLKTFNVDMAYVEQNIRTSCQNSLVSNCEYTNVDGDYFYNYEVSYVLGFTQDFIDLPFGYKDLGNRYYEVYSYLGTLCVNYEVLNSENPDIECEEVKPTDKDVYGEDYIIQVYEYEDENGKDVIEYQPLKIIGYVKTKIYYDGEFVKFISLENVSEKDMINKKELISDDNTPSVEVKNDDISVSADKGVFVNGTKVTIDKITDGKVYEIVTKALKEKASSFIVYDINAKAGDYEVQPNGKVKISIKIPDYYKNAVIYYVSEDGTFEKMDTKVVDGYATAELEHFSMYALVDEKQEDNPNTSVFNRIDFIIAMVVLIGVVAYIGLKKSKRYHSVKI